MGTAALLVARTYKIQSVYRDIDAKDDTLTVIQFDEDLPESGDIPINRCPFNNHIKWEKLYSKSQKKKETRTVEQILESLYKDF